ncbi:hypothetical protein E5A73_14930 [Sphingomonas gei]|uniref:Uncharacterized protein n=1 Tax=Sphingomonas gei TaxID=1395960 RepID=A0A4S1X7V9_9SPHN|nr:hypothetical protein [Sphingomonas gei]TGX52108.1 hypothetical protein E5A73_14930 [Sphingomonas gei]
MSYILLLAVAFQSVAPVDLPALDAAIERCERSAVLPVFAAEARRRSAAVTAFYQEQAQIVAERLATANQRRVLRESPATATPASSDQELSLRQLSLDDRQRALDDQRRLETMRQEALDLKRQYFLTHCPANRKAD